MAVLPTPGSPIQHRIVLGAAAENLDDAVDFAVATDQGVELAVHGGLGQVAGKLGEQRRFALPLWCGFLLRAAGEFFANSRKAQARARAESRRQSTFPL